MKKKKGTLSTGNIRTYRITIIAFALICVFMGTVSYQYYKHLQNTVKEESRGYLMEISKHIAGNVSKTLVDNFSVLGTIANVLKSAEITSYSQLQPIIQIQKKEWNYENILLVDEDGIAYGADGSTVTLGGDTYLRDVVVSGKRSMSASQVINNKECIVFTIPIEGLTIDGIQMNALAATYDLSTFDQILAINTFDGQGYAHIIQKDGTVAVRSSSKYAEKSGYNILSTIADAEFEGAVNLETIKKSIQGGQSDQVVFSRKGQREYMIYTPLEAQEWYLLTFVPLSVVNQKAEMLMKTTLMLCGFITFSFAVLIAFLMMSFYRHKSKLEQIAYVDPITGGNTIQRFYDVAEANLSLQTRPEYALIYTNIEKFKVLNEQFGRRACNEMLSSIEHGVSTDLVNKEIIGRLAADNFCILVEYESESVLLQRIEKWYREAKDYMDKKDIVWLAPVIEYGVFVINNESMPFAQMVDRAKLALRESGRELKGRIRFAIYNDAVRKTIFREKYLEDRMEAALENNEFQVYLQPKYQVQNEKIGGAEALVRWISEEGMIFPDEFISLFEKNGFILELDLWVFDQVCKTIRKWMDQGLTPMKVSVNCSRVHLKNPDFLQCYRDICTKRQVPPKYLEIELTENVVFEDVEHLSKTIDDIHAAGFGCSMDDFGSGYSSLNLIQDIPVDTIKLDKIFFRSGTKDIKRMESVVGSILTMSKALDMQIVAEGVEEREQVDMLKRLECDYIQGYYFSKPIPIVEFEKIAFPES